MSSCLRSTAALCLLVGLLLPACATPLAEDALERRLRFVGHSVLGPQAHFSVVPVSADSPMMAWTLVAGARIEGPGAEARYLRNKLRPGSASATRVVVGGPFPALTQQIVLDAFALNRERALPGLTLVVVGGDETPPEIHAAAQRVGARVLHRQLP